MLLSHLNTELILINTNINYSCHFPTANTNKSNINVLFLNIRSLRNKINDLTNYVKYNRVTYHLIILNETWLTKSETNLICMPGYHTFHTTRVKPGGGVTIFVLKTLNRKSVRIL